MKGGETGPAIVAGNSEESLLVRRMLGLDGDDRMPKDGDPLPSAQIALIRAWIDQGATWPATAAETAAPAPARDPEPKHWAYRVPERPATTGSPQTANGYERRSISSSSPGSKRKVSTPSAEAPLETLVRRVSLDLDRACRHRRRSWTKSWPTPAGRSATRPISRLVDRLLASPHYGERWARPWLDLARYADSHGFEKDLPRVMWKYRDWVIDALNRDMPFDRFTIEQIAGDMLPNATRDQLVASGFHRNAMTNEEGGIDPGGSALRSARRSRQHDVDRLARHHARLRAVSQPQIRPLHPEGLLPDDGVLHRTPTTKCASWETARSSPRRRSICRRPSRKPHARPSRRRSIELNEKMKAQTPALERAQAVWEQAMRTRGVAAMAGPDRRESRGKRRGDPDQATPDRLGDCFRAQSGLRRSTPSKPGRRFRASRRSASRRCQIRRCRKADLDATSTATSR